MENNIGDARRSYALTRPDGKYTQEDAARDFDVSLSAYRRWEQGVSKGLQGKHLIMMAEKFGTTADYLIGKTDKPTANHAVVNICETEKLTDDERELLDIYRSLSQPDRETAIRLMTALAPSSGDTCSVETA